MLTDLKINSNLFNEIEKKIFDSRQVGKAVYDLSDEELDVSVTGIIFKIAVICGCSLPDQEAHIAALENEFIIFLKDYGYGELTTEEILSAFRMNANGMFNKKIETFGKVFNIDFAGSVIRQYYEKRSGLDRIIVDDFEKEQRDVEMEDFCVNRRKNIINQFDIFLKDDTVELNLSDCYMQLCEDGAFADKKLYMRFANGDIPADAINRIKNFRPYGGVWDGFDEVMEETFDAEKKTVYYLFKQMKLSGRNKIYDENLKLLNPGFMINETERKPDEF